MNRPESLDAGMR